MTKKLQDWSSVPKSSTPPDFNNLLAVLRREKPARPTLFEFFLNGPVYEKLAANDVPRKMPEHLSYHLNTIYAFRNAGYDYVTLGIPDFGFPTGEVHQSATRSMNEGALISDRATFNSYPWPDPALAQYKIMDELAPALPKGMKFIIHGPCGVLENVMKLVGYEALCYLILDDPDLAADVFDGVGSRLVDYYQRCIGHSTVGAIIGNDDWGFKSQPMLSPEDLRRFVFPWHKKIVAIAHAAGKPAILHSCGRLTSVMDDIVNDMRYDGKHSYEDTIQPVEEAYDMYHDRIAIMGGIDLDFVCRRTPEEIYKRSKQMLERAARSGAYALGTGNSVPEYVPYENYFAMIRAALDMR